MNLTKAVVLLETKYKPVKEWPDGKVIPRDLPEDEEVKKAWKVIIDNRDQKTPKEMRIQKTKDIYKDFSKRKEEMKQDILDGYSLRELSRKYGPKDMIRGLKRVKLYDLFKKMCPLKIGWYAYNGQNTTFFKNIEEARIFTDSPSREEFYQKYRKNGESFEGYEFYSFQEFKEVNSNAPKIVDEYLKHNGAKVTFLNL